FPRPQPHAGRRSWHLQSLSAESPVQSPEPCRLSHPVCRNRPERPLPFPPSSAPQNTIHPAGQPHPPLLTHTPAPVGFAAQSLPHLPSVAPAPRQSRPYAATGFLPEPPPAPVRPLAQCCSSA